MQQMRCRYHLLLALPISLVYHFGSAGRHVVFPCFGTDTGNSFDGRIGKSFKRVPVQCLGGNTGGALINSDSHVSTFRLSLDIHSSAKEPDV
jgi:hypothetical protein